MSIQGWQNLTCSCGNNTFVARHEILWQKDQGTTTRPAGYACAGCMKTISTADLVLRAKERDLRKQVEELEAQIGR